MKATQFTSLLTALLLSAGLLAGCGSSEESVSVGQSTFGDQAAFDSGIGGDFSGSSPVGSFPSDNNEQTEIENAVVSSEGLAFALSEGRDSYAVIGYGSCTDTDIVIPASHEGLPVTEIAESAFKKNTAIKSVLIPNSVTTIGKAAFEFCSDLQSISIPDSVTTLDQWAFHACSSLTDVTLSNGITCIELATFYGCEQLSELVIPDSVTTIKEKAFGKCTRLTQITIPDGVTVFGQGVFYNCEQLTDITLPNSLTVVAAYLFEGCTSLKSVSIPAGVATIGGYAFKDCTSLTDVNFAGSMETWETYTTGTRYDICLPASCVVHCTDGDISK